MELQNKHCVPCEGGAAALQPEEANRLLQEIPDWRFNETATKISKEFVFKDFLAAMAFVDKIATLAESEGHHPDIHIFYNKVLIELSTHAVNGLSENDFILAAKLEEIH